MLLQRFDQNRNGAIDGRELQALATAMHQMMSRAQQGNRGGFQGRGGQRGPGRGGQRGPGQGGQRGPGQGAKRGPGQGGKKKR